eukprot:TRINITY_DN5661_c0_g1_i3.p1 TRINITY_DN5661_c0_g1~~TRINITY_DN5661_c0_g1_i3.p1  ORF type:complete len:101 (-),score=13.34 TRINITY_DN5661_c0_g1_i3:142-444(-)
MGASAAAPTPLPRDKSVIATLHYLFWYDMDYPHSQYSGYQDMLPESIYGIPYKIGTKSIPSIRFLNTVSGCTKYIVIITCLLYTSPSPRDLSTSRMPSSA